MKRDDVLSWLETHPRCVHGDARRLLDRCEEEVRRHSEEDAWLHAKAIVEVGVAAMMAELGYAPDEVPGSAHIATLIQRSST